MPSGISCVGARTSDLMRLVHLLVGGVLLQVDMNALGDLKQPAPLGLQGVHVSLHTTTITTQSKSDTKTQ